MAEIPNVRLSLPGSAENVLVVRQALSGVAASITLDAIESNDVNTAVSEACNNVVMHAYDGGEGPLEVDVFALRGAIAVVVRDHGSGIRPRELDAEEAHTGMGIPVIHALTRRAEFTNLAGGGTEVRMEFDTPKARPLDPIDDDGDGDMSVARMQSPLEDAVELQLAPNAIARSVLPRVLSALAARAYFSTDRITDVRHAADELTANAGESISGTRLDVGVMIAPRNLQLRVGPLRRGGTLAMSLLDERTDSR
jgi:serine/threonine-protein kinase RsbW